MAELYKNVAEYVRAELPELANETDEDLARYGASELGLDLDWTGSTNAPKTFKPIYVPQTMSTGEMLSGKPQIADVSEPPPPPVTPPVQDVTQPRIVPGANEMKWPVDVARAPTEQPPQVTLPRQASKSSMTIRPGEQVQAPEVGPDERLPKQYPSGGELASAQISQMLGMETRAKAADVRSEQRSAEFFANMPGQENKQGSFEQLTQKTKQTDENLKRLAGEFDAQIPESVTAANKEYADYLASTEALKPENIGTTANAVAGTMAFYLPQVIVGAIPIAGLYINYRQERGNFLQGAEQYNIDQKYKDKYSAYYGVPAAITEYGMDRFMMGMGGPVKNIVGKLTGPILKAVSSSTMKFLLKPILGTAAGMLGEGLQEGGTQYLQNLLTYAAASENLKDAKAAGDQGRVDELTQIMNEIPINVDDKSVIQSTVIGAIVGGGPTAVTQAAQAGIKTTPKTPEGSAITQPGIDQANEDIAQLPNVGEGIPKPPGKTTQKIQAYVNQSQSKTVKGQIPPVVTDEESAALAAKKDAAAQVATRPTRAIPAVQAEGLPPSETAVKPTIRMPVVKKAGPEEAAPPVVPPPMTPEEEAQAQEDIATAETEENVAAANKPTISMPIIKEAKEVVDNRKEVRVTLEMLHDDLIKEWDDAGKYRNVDPAIRSEMAMDAVRSASRNQVTKIQGKAAKNSLLDRMRNKPTPNTKPMIIELDIDFFKRVNDSLGHSYGDEALRNILIPTHKKFQEIGLEHFHDSGDENSAIGEVPIDQYQQKMDQADDVKKALEILRLQFPEKEIDVPVSMTMAISDKLGEDADILLKNAKEDTKLGRNSFVVDSDLQKLYNKSNRKGPDVSKDWEKAGLKITSREIEASGGKAKDAISKQQDRQDISGLRGGTGRGNEIPIVSPKQTSITGAPAAPAAQEVTPPAAPSAPAGQGVAATPPAVTPVLSKEAKTFIDEATTGNKAALSAHITGGTEEAAVQAFKDAVTAKGQTPAKDAAVRAHVKSVIANFEKKYPPKQAPRAEKKSVAVKAPEQPRQTAEPAPEAVESANDTDIAPLRDSGVVKAVGATVRDVTAEMDDAELRKIGLSRKAIADTEKATGKKVVIFEADRDTGFDGAKVDDKHIYVNRKTGVKGRNVIGHELSHHMEKEAPAAWQIIRRAVVDAPGFKKYRADYEARVKRARPDIKTAELSDKAIEQELVADFLGDHFQEVMARAQYKAGSKWGEIVAKVQAFLQGIVDKMAGVKAVDYEAARFVRDVKKALSTTTAMMQQYQKRVGQKQVQSKPEEQESIASTNPTVKMPVVGDNVGTVKIDSYDRESGERGSYLANNDGDAITPIFTDINDLYAYLRNNDYKQTDAIGAQTYEIPMEKELVSVSRQQGQEETIDVDGTERPRTNSDGKPIASTDDALRNFWRWFGDSKVVDEQGRPKVVYHAGLFDETENGVPEVSEAGMHFGTKDAAMERQSGKMVDDNISGMEVTQDDENKKWYYTLGDGTDSYDMNEDGYDSESEARRAGEQDATDMNYELDEEMPTTEAYLSIKNPIQRPDQKASWVKAIEGAKSKGHDGIFYINRFEDKGSDSYLVFSPTQIKSATGNVGAFSPENPDIRMSVTKNPTPKGDDYEQGIINDDGMIDWLVQKWINRSQSVENIERAAGGDFAVTVAQNAFPGKVLAEKKQVDKEYVQPIFDAIAKNKLTMDEVQGILYANHAEERNDWLREHVKNPRGEPKWEPQDGPSGWTDQEAIDFKDKMEKAGKLKKLNEVADLVYKMNREALRIRVEFGLITEEGAAELQRRWPHYVPLKGFAPDMTKADLKRHAELNKKSVAGTLTEDDKAEFAQLQEQYYERPKQGGGGSRGFQGKKKEFKTARGRKSEAVKLLENSLADIYSVIRRSQANVVGNDLFDFIMNHPSPLFTISPVTTIAAIDAKTGDINEKYAPTQKYTIVSHGIRGKGKHTELIEPLRVWRNGLPFDIQINHYDMARFMQNLDIRALGWVWRQGLTWNRYMSMILTQLNLEFGPFNFLRDLQTAMFNAGGLGDVAAPENMKGIAWSIFKRVLPSLRASFKGEFEFAEGSKDREWYDEFEKAGGKTGFSTKDDIDFLTKEAEKQIRLAQNKPLRYAKLMFDSIGKINGTIENGIRLATYIEMRKRDLLPEKAAYVAKNVTVNFNQMGEYGPYVKAMYVFSNPNIQGTARMIKAMDFKKRPWMLPALGGMIATSYGLAALTRALLGASGGDDDEEKEITRLINTRMAERQDLLDKLKAGSLDDEETKKLSDLNDEYAGLTDAQKAVLEYGGDDVYDQIPVNLKQMNIIFPNFLSKKKGDVITLPLAYGLNVFWALGQGLEAAVASKDPKKGIITAFGVAFGPLINAFNFAGQASSMLQLIAPTALRPAVSLVENKDWTGKPIMKKNIDVGKKKAQGVLSMKGTSPMFKEFARFLHEKTGGLEYEKGLIERLPWGGEYLISADAQEYMVEYLTGGVGRLINNTVKTLTSVAKGEPVKTRNIPFYRRFVYEITEESGTKEYYDYIRKAEQKNAQYMSYAEDAALYKKAFPEESKKLDILKKEYYNKNKEWIRIYKASQPFQNIREDLATQRRYSEALHEDEKVDAYTKKINRVLGAANRYFRTIEKGKFNIPEIK